MQSQKKLGWDDLEFVFTDVDTASDPMEEAQIQQILLQAGVLTSVEEGVFDLSVSAI